MAEQFDPYHRWLGISPKDQPPNHYRLFGIDLFENNVEVIRDAAERQMAHVRTYQLGQHSVLSQQILNELGGAKACLLDPAAKAAYDAELKQSLPKPEDARPPPLLAQADRQTPGGLLGAIPFRAQILLVSAGTAFVLVAIVVAFHAGRGNPRREAPNVAQETSAAGEEEAAKTGESIPQSASALSPEASDMNPVQPIAETHAPQPKPVEPATYTVQLDPPTATLRVNEDKGTVTGTGADRTVTIERPDRYSYVLITAEREGYEKVEKWLTPVPGVKETLLISLKTARAEYELWEWQVRKGKPLRVWLHPGGLVGNGPKPPTTPAPVWSRSGNTTTVRWPNGFVDTMELQPNGRSMIGKNQRGVRITARRVEP